MCRQYAMAAGLVGRPEAGEGGQPFDAPSARFTAAHQLEIAGGEMSLTEAANALGATPQNLHKRTHVGSALGNAAPKVSSSMAGSRARIGVSGEGRVASITGTTGRSGSVSGAAGHCERAEQGQRSRHRSSSAFHFDLQDFTKGPMKGG